MSALAGTTTRARSPRYSTRVSRSVDPASGVGEVRARLAARSDAPLLTTVGLSVVLSVRRGALVVPSASLRRSEEGREEVVLVVKGVAEVRPVKAGVASSGLVEIVEGLAGGETVVVESPLGLVAGQPLAAKAGAGR